jgi:DNA-binding helix-hairpin-helix protein with protein kinase domain
VTARTFRTGSGRRIEAGNPISAGAAGEAVEVEGDAGLVLKLLKAPTAGDEQRVKAMLSLNVSARLSGAAAVIAWPTDLVFDGNRFAGFLMPRAPQPAPVNLSILAQRRERETRLTENFAWNGLLTIARNYVAAIEALHAGGVIACDINLKNVMVSGDQTVTVIDCDSMQFKAGGRQYLTSFHKVEFLAPEFRGVDLGKIPRTYQSDCWALAVLLFMVLMDGHHPLAGVWNGSGEPDLADHGAAGRFPYAAGSGKLRPSPEAPPWRALPGELQSLFTATFTKGAKAPDERATPKQWSTALASAGRRLQLCKGPRQHYFPATERSCPWCEYEEYLGGQPKRAKARGGGNAAPKVTTQESRYPAGGSVQPKAPRQPFTPPPSPRPQPTPGLKPNPASSGSGAGLAAKLVVAALILLVLVGLVASLGLTDGNSGISFGGGGDGDGGSGGSSGPPAPVRAIRAHYRALDEGRYGHSFALMAPSYRRGNRRWISQMKTAGSRINVIRVGHPRVDGGSAWMPILFYARDTYDTEHSDTLCRRFSGWVHMVRTSEGWRYDPAGRLDSRVSNAARCP